MTEPTPPPVTAPPPYAPPPAPPPPKKGLSPLAWVGIGCGALAVVTLIVVAIVFAMAAKKGKEFLSDFESNPAFKTAEFAIRANPELELVESDSEAGTLTVRNKKTGEVVTVDLDDIEQGRLSVLTGEGEESTITFGGESGGLEIRAEEGGKTSRLRIGAEPDEIPDWVPVYPGAQPASTFVSTTAEGTNGAFSLTTSDQPDEVLDWYAEELEDLGIDPQRSMFTTTVSRGGLVSGESGGRRLDVTVASQNEGTSVTVTFNGP